jgi:hypothetical protein
VTRGTYTPNTTPKVHRGERRNMRAHVALLAAVTAIATGCSASTAPKGAVTGRWTFTATKIADSADACEFNVPEMSLTQQGSTFTGTYSQGLLTCDGDANDEAGPFSGQVLHGQINGAKVTFDFDKTWQLTGTVSGDSMSGTAVVSTSAFPGALANGTLSGTWRAGR